MRDSASHKWLQYLKGQPWVIRPWARVRAWQQESKIHQEQAHYEQLARKRKVSVMEEHQVKEALHRRLSQRGLKPTPSAVGQLHTVYASAMSNWEPHQIPPALARFGPFTLYSCPERGFSPQCPDRVPNRHQLDADLLAFLTTEHRRQPVDVFISYLSGWQVAPETIRAIGDLGIITCAFHWDDRLGFRGELMNGRWTGPAAFASAYDLNLSNSSASLIKYFVEGGLAIFWPLGANPDHFRPLSQNFKYDVSFIGACYGQRPIFIDYLRKHGIQVETFGPGWPNGAVSEEAMVEIYASSRINLGFSGVGYSMKEMCLKGRDFEVPMCGALYLTSEQPDLYRVYKVGEEVLTYTSKNDCLAKIHYLLGHPEECALIRQKARERCVRDHTWEKRFHSLFELIGLID